MMTFQLREIGFLSENLDGFFKFDPQIFFGIGEILPFRSARKRSEPAR